MQGSSLPCTSLPTSITAHTAHCTTFNAFILTLGSILASLWFLAARSGTAHQHARGRYAHAATRPACAATTLHAATPLTGTYCAPTTRWRPLLPGGTPRRAASTAGCFWGLPRHACAFLPLLHYLHALPPPLPPATPARTLRLLQHCCLLHLLLPFHHLPPRTFSWVPSTC